MDRASDEFRSIRASSSVTGVGRYVIAEAVRIHQQTVVLRIMPIGNLTQMSEDERVLIDAWYQTLNNNK